MIRLSRPAKPTATELEVFDDEAADVVGQVVMLSSIWGRTEAP